MSKEIESCCVNFTLSLWHEIGQCPQGERSSGFVVVLLLLHFPLPPAGLVVEPALQRPDVAKRLAQVPAGFAVTGCATVAAADAVLAVVGPAF